MRRKIESLTYKRQELEKEFNLLLQKLKELTPSFPEGERQKAQEEFLAFPERPSKKSWLGKKHKFEDQLLSTLLQNWRRTQQIIEHQHKQISLIVSHLEKLFSVFHQLVEAKDREWDALSSNHVGMIFKSLEWRVEKLAVEAQDARMLVKKLYFLRDKLDNLIQLLREQKEIPQQLSRQILDSLKDATYASFENRFRGDEAQVKQQLAPYVDLFPKGKIIDLGCGRGEFLELLREKGLEAEGVDSNQEMVEYCREKGLICHQEDLLTWLMAQPDESLGGIFSSQVIEHLPPSYLEQLIQLAYFKLAPGGRLILETVNPTSVFALVQVYFLDLSHTQPIHPLALQFLFETHGFAQTRLIYGEPPQTEQLESLAARSEISEIFNRNVDKLNKLLYSPLNYAVIGEKI